MIENGTAGCNIEFSSSDDDQPDIVAIDNINDVLTDENSFNIKSDECFKMSKQICNGFNARERLIILPSSCDNSSIVKRCTQTLPKIYGQHARKVTMSKNRKDRNAKLRSFIQELSSLQKRSYFDGSSTASTIAQFSKDELNCLAILLLHLMKFSLNTPLMPTSNGIADDYSTTDYHSQKLDFLSRRLSKRPLFTFFECVCNDSSLIPLLGTMYSQQPRIGYLFLLYLYVRNPADSDYERDAKIFRSLFVISEEGDQSLVEKAMADCHRDEIELFFFLLPFAAAGCQVERPATKAITRVLSNEDQDPLLSLNSVSTVKLIVSTASSIILNDLACRLCTGEVVLFDEDRTLHKLIRASSKWTPFERNNLWILLQAQLPHSIIASLFRYVRKDHVASQTIAQHILCSGLRLGHVRSVFARQPPDIYSKMIIARWCDDDTLKDFIEHFTAIVGSLKRMRRPPRKRANKRRKREFSQSEGSAVSGTDGGSDSDIMTSSGGTSDLDSLDSSDEERNPTKANYKHRLSVDKILCHLDKMRTQNNSDSLRFLVDRSVCCAVCQASATVGLRVDQQVRYQELLQLMKDFSKENEIRSERRRARKSFVQQADVTCLGDTLPIGTSSQSVKKCQRSSEANRAATNNAINKDAYGWKPAIRKTLDSTDTNSSVHSSSSTSESSNV